MSQKTKQLTVKQYAELRDVSTSYVNKLLLSLESLEATEAIMLREHSKNHTRKRIESKRRALVGVLSYEWIGQQRVLTVDLEVLPPK